MVVCRYLFIYCFVLGYSIPFRIGFRTDADEITIGDQDGNSNTNELNDVMISCETQNKNGNGKNFRSDTKKSATHKTNANYRNLKSSKEINW